MTSTEALAVRQAILDGEAQLLRVQGYLRARMREMGWWATVALATVCVSGYVVVVFTQRVMEGGGFVYAGAAALNILCGFGCARSLLAELREWLSLYQLQRRMQRWLSEMRGLVP